MKSFLLSLCAGCLLASLPCHAQEPTPAEQVAPLLDVYVARDDANPLPRIVLGMEKPTLQITSFAKCMQITAIDSELAGLVVELKPDDAKALLAAVQKVASPAGGGSVGVILWLTSPDNKALDRIPFDSNSAATNLTEAGVIEFNAARYRPTVVYLTEKLHPK